MRRLTILLWLLAAAAVAGYDALSTSGEWLINAYKSALSPLQGRNMCNFWPTCSQFTRQAIESRGFIEGTVIGADRLMRCHAGAWAYLDRYYFGVSHDRLVDPVSNHVAGQAPGNEPKDLSLVALEPDALPAGRDSSAGAPGPMLGFADHLYGTGDFSRAAAEYLRTAFADTAPGRGAYARLMAAESFLRAGDFARSRAAFLDCTDPGVSGYARFGASRAWFAQGEYDSARALLQVVTDSGLSGRTRALAGWSLLKQYRFSDAASLFRAGGRDSTLTPLAAFDGTGLARRSRLAGTLLSAALPGAGHVYAGRAADGIYSFLTVAGSGLVTGWFASHPDKDRTRIKVSLFGAVTALFYAANVYGANVAARDYNRFQERQYLGRAEAGLDSLDLAPDYGWLLGTHADSCRTDDR